MVNLKDIQKSWQDGKTTVRKFMPDNNLRSQINWKSSLVSMVQASLSPGNRSITRLKNEAWIHLSRYVNSQISSYWRPKTHMQSMNIHCIWTRLIFGTRYLQWTLISFMKILTVSLWTDLYGICTTISRDWSDARLWLS